MNQFNRGVTVVEDCSFLLVVTLLYHYFADMRVTQIINMFPIFLVLVFGDVHKTYGSIHGNA